MDLTGIIQGIESSGLGEWMRNSVKAMPVVESIHVMAVAVVFGSILIVDLRLLGFLDTRRPFSRLSKEMLRWTWGAFAVAVVTGAVMFAANAMTYYQNVPFRWKMLALLGAGVNMAVFQFVTSKSLPNWDSDAPSPAPARLAGALSILLWTSVIFLGRWIGFTKGYNFDVPEDIQFDFSALQEGVMYFGGAAASAFV